MTKFDDYGSRVTLAMVASLAVAACSQAQEEKSYEAAVEDESGGELIVTQPDPGAVEVNLPETEMTNVPATDEGDDSVGE
ncbi:hypothetical protein BPTFM16_02451 [Altererythrobacter insulae]|nr:hypothetical protein BPTFM16_02451 [Altererythrobacter insulae]